MANRKRRIAELSAELDESNLTRAQSNLYSSKPDDSLFLLDRSGTKLSKKLSKRINDQQNNDFQSSKNEKVLIDKIIKKTLNKSQETEIKPHNELKDLWTDQETNTKQSINELQTFPKSKNRPNYQQFSSKKQKIIRPGQSYNPLPNQHQDLLAEAVALEIQAKAKKDKINEDYLYLSVLNNSEGSDNDSNNSVDENSTNENKRKSRLKKKLTKAERNKIRNRNINEYNDLKLKEQSEILKSIDELPVILRQITEEEQIVENKRLLTEQQKLKREEYIKQNPLSYEDIPSVPLSDELNGSLRTIIPKGVPVSQRVLDLKNAGQVMAKDRRKRRAHEKPHGPKRLIWHSRYKVENI
eukprot:gene4995-6980_t